MSRVHRVPQTNKQQDGFSFCSTTLLNYNLAVGEENVTGDDDMTTSQTNQTGCFEKHGLVEGERDDREQR